MSFQPLVGLALYERFSCLTLRIQRIEILPSAPYRPRPVSDLLPFLPRSKEPGAIPLRAGAMLERLRYIWRPFLRNASFTSAVGGSCHSRTRMVPVRGSGVVGSGRPLML